VFEGKSLFGLNRPMEKFPQIGILRAGGGCFPLLISVSERILGRSPGIESTLNAKREGYSENVGLAGGLGQQLIEKKTEVFSQGCVIGCS
jgi:hypothetical protein